LATVWECDDFESCCSAGFQLYMTYAWHTYMELLLVLIRPFMVPGNSVWMSCMSIVHVRTNSPVLLPVLVDLSSWWKRGIVDFHVGISPVGYASLLWESFGYYIL
jgi:hypothetical protein